MKNKIFEITENGLEKAKEAIADIPGIDSESQQAMENIFNCLVGKKVEPTQTFKVTDKFRNKQDSYSYHFYMIGRTYTDCWVQIINLTNGRIWKNSCFVKDSEAITNKELNMIFNCKNWKEKFIYIEERTGE